jgi:hypothetical protein
LDHVAMTSTEPASFCSWASAAAKLLYSVASPVARSRRFQICGAGGCPCLGRGGLSISCRPRRRAFHAGDNRGRLRFSGIKSLPCGPAAKRVVRRRESRQANGSCPHNADDRGDRAKGKG